MIVKNKNVYKVNSEQVDPYNYCTTYVRASSVEEVINILKQTVNYNDHIIKDISLMGSLLEQNDR